MKLTPFPAGARGNTRRMAAIEWSGASVEGGRLTVPFDAKAPADFKAQLIDLIDRLDQGGRAWGDVKVTRSGLSVADVSEGAESDLRHFLEAAVLQANANLGEDEDDDDEPGSDGERSETDERMTETFRDFAG
jgi:hypothetical protein